MFLNLFAQIKMLMELENASYWNLSLKKLSSWRKLVSPSIIFIKCGSHSMLKESKLPLLS